MNRKRFSMQVVITVLGILLLGCSAPGPVATLEPTQPVAAGANVATQEAQGRAIVVGDIGDTPSQIIEDTQPLANYLAKNLSQYGITRGEVKVASSMDEMAQLMKDGKVDIYFDSVYPAMLISDASGGTVFIRRWKEGVSEYHTMIFANKKSNITSLDQLKGHTIAFEESFSTSGYLLPLAYMTKHGLTMTEKALPTDLVESNEVGYTISGNDANTIQWVLNGTTPAGAVENGAYNELRPDVKDQLIILAETESLPRHVGMMRPGIAPDLQAAITKLLLNADQNNEGKSALDKFSKTTKFDLFPEGIDAALIHIRELVSTVKAARKP